MTPCQSEDYYRQQRKSGRGVERWPELRVVTTHCNAMIGSAIAQCRMMAVLV